MMETLRAAVEELHATAAEWASRAGECSATAPGVSGSFQPSTTAVAAIHAGVAVASATLTARTQITAVKTTAAASAYTQQEATSAALLNALGESL
jgi:hypothetical protein